MLTGPRAAAQFIFAASVSSPAAGGDLSSLSRGEIFLGLDSNEGQVLCMNPAVAMILLPLLTRVIYPRVGWLATPEFKSTGVSCRLLTISIVGPLVVMVTKLASGANHARAASTDRFLRCASLTFEAVILSSAIVATQKR